jgi:excisionase family DNA binding protein
MKHVSAMRACIHPCACWLALALATQLCFSLEAADDQLFADSFEDIVFADGFEPVGPSFGDAQAFTLALPTAPSPVSIVLDKTKLNSVITAAEQKQLVLRNVDPAPAISTALATLVNQCGAGWQFDNPNPNYDCSATGWAGPGGDWHTSSEYNLVRLLTLTPANSVLTGTTVQDLVDIASSLSIGGGEQQMLSDLLGISRTSVQKMVDSGLLRAMRTAGGHRRILRSSVLAVLGAQPMLLTGRGGLDAHADKAPADSVRSFYPSLYLNLGKSYEDVGDIARARELYERGVSNLAEIPEGGYLDIVREGLRAGRQRTEA